MDRVVLRKAFNKFLLNSKIDIKFKNELSYKDIKNILVKVINSEYNYFDGEYDDYKSFINIVNMLEEKTEEESTNILEYSKPQINLKDTNEYKNKVLNKKLMIYNLTIFLEDLGMDSKNGYLETRSWYTNSKDLQEKTITVALQGNAVKIDVYSEDYLDHILSIMY